jgi:hypothetical protein
MTVDARSASAHGGAEYGQTRRRARAGKVCPLEVGSFLPRLGEAPPGCDAIRHELDEEASVLNPSTAWLLAAIADFALLPHGIASHPSHLRVKAPA